MAHSGDKTDPTRSTPGRTLNVYFKVNFNNNNNNNNNNKKKSGLAQAGTSMF